VGCRKDDYAFFLTPVDVSKVPGYTDAVKRPMDFGTMTTKVGKGKYRSLEDFAVSVFSNYVLL
jgi:bromodomain-containing protein 7